jgi:formylglycine-generating enzyme required for sulfatase activity
MHFRTFTLIYLLCVLRLSAQDKGPEFLSRIRLSGEDALKKEQILSGLKSLTLLSEEKEALEDIEKAKAHNSLLDTKDKEIETAILQLQNNASALAGLGGLLELRQTISEQQKSRDKFQEEFEKQLQQNTKTKGLYLIVLPNSINEVEWDAKRFKSTAQQLLKSRAVKELNEVFISSLTEVVNRMEVSQRIRSRVSGSMLVEETPFEKRRPAAKDYVILQYLNVSPMTSGDEKGTMNRAESEIKALHLINCANEADVERTLKTLGLSAEDESALRGRINEYIRKAKDANVNSKGSISNMWTALNNQLEKLNSEIELARKTELEKNNQLRNLSSALCPEGMRSTQLKDSLQELHRKLDQYRVSITDKKREYEAGRFYLKEKLKITIGDGAPTAVISEGILKAVQDINTSYGNRSVYSEQILVVDKMVQEAEIKGTVLRRGSLKDVWVHIHTGNEEYFVTLISRFEVNREKDTITKEEPLKDPGKVVSEGATLKILSNVSGELKIDGISKGRIEKNNIKIFSDLKVGEYYIQLIPDNGWAVLSKKYTLNSGKAEILEFISSLPDRDGDGVEDNRDDCPNEKGLISLKGCPDSDGDGISNIEDECPLLPGDTKNYGCPNVAGMSFMVGVNTTIGCKPCGNQQEVTLSNYYIANYEITVGEFKEFIEKSGYVTDAEKIGSSYIQGGLISVERKNISWKFDENGKKLKGDNEKRPVLHISINDAEAYCKWLSQNTGKLYRLPNEAEWEYAASGGNLNKKYNYSNGDNINNRNETVYYDSKSRIESVGKYKPNEMGLYDMMENVGEWCYNFYDSKKVVSRGRSFKDFSQNFSVYTRFSNQISGKDMRDNRTGFRILLVQ